MLNIDLKEFFHSVTEAHVKKVIDHYLCPASDALKTLLHRLVLYHHRLPMGAPTSPVLSNFACLDLDAELSNYCKASKICYTRYADDLTFSSEDMIHPESIRFIRSAIAQYHFSVNEDKVKVYSEADIKMVTGIVVNSDGIELPMGYIDQLAVEILRYRAIIEAETRFRTGMSFRKLKLFRQELMGKWNFANMVEPNNSRVQEVRSMLDEAFLPPESFESIDWLEIPYF